jgi:hypothetical protein
MLAFLVDLSFLVFIPVALVESVINFVTSVFVVIAIVAISFVLAVCV